MGMTRRRFTERQVIETLIRQGAAILSYRSKEPITLENVGTVEREHILERALGGEDTPVNCAYSLGKEHHVVTNGTKATTAGSSKHKIAKTARLARLRAVIGPPVDALAAACDTAPRQFVPPSIRCRCCGEDFQDGVCPNCGPPRSRPFQKRQAVRG